MMQPRLALLAFCWAGALLTRQVEALDPPRRVYGELIHNEGRINYGECYSVDTNEAWTFSVMGRHTKHTSFAFYNGYNTSSSNYEVEYMEVSVDVNYHDYDVLDNSCEVGVNGVKCQRCVNEGPNITAIDCTNAPNYGVYGKLYITEKGGIGFLGRPELCEHPSVVEQQSQEGGDCVTQIFESDDSASGNGSLVNVHSCFDKIRNGCYVYSNDYEVFFPSENRGAIKFASVQVHAYTGCIDQESSPDLCTVRVDSIYDTRYNAEFNCTNTRTPASVSLPANDPLVESIFLKGYRTIRVFSGLPYFPLAYDPLVDDPVEEPHVQPAAVCMPGKSREDSRFDVRSRICQRAYNDGCVQASEKLDFVDKSYFGYPYEQITVSQFSGCDTPEQKNGCYINVGGSLQHQCKLCESDQGNLTRIDCSNVPDNRLSLEIRLDSNGAIWLADASTLEPSGVGSSNDFTEEPTEPPQILPAQTWTQDPMIINTYTNEPTEPPPHILPTQPTQASTQPPPFIDLVPNQPNYISTPEPTSGSSELSTWGGTDFDYFVENDYWDCTDLPRDYSVMVDLQITHKRGSIAPACSPNQDSSIRMNVGVFLNNGFEFSVRWPGAAWFDRFSFDPNQIENGHIQESKCGKGGLRCSQDDPPVRCGPGSEGIRHCIPPVCPPRSIDMPCKGDLCRFGCIVAHTTNCEIGEPSFQEWESLGGVLRMALKHLRYECLGDPNKLQVLVKVDPIQLGGDGPVFNPTHSPTYATTAPQSAETAIAPPKQVEHEGGSSSKTFEQQYSETTADEDTSKVLLSSSLQFFFPPDTGSQPDDERLSQIMSSTVAFLRSVFLHHEGMKARRVNITADKIVSHYDEATPDRFEVTFEIAIGLQEDGATVSRGEVVKTLSTANWNEYLNWYINRNHYFAHHPSKVDFQPGRTGCLINTCI